jgi:hypothetical protein
MLEAKAASAPGQPAAALSVNTTTVDLDHQRAMHCNLPRMI